MTRYAVASLGLLLMGCPYMGPQTYETRIQDVDGDGAIGVRFGGPDCRDNNAAITTCDADGDGDLAAGLGGTDCDDTEPTVFAGAPEICDGLDNDCNGAIDNDDEGVTSTSTFYADGDGDGHGDPATPLVCQEYADRADPDSGLHIGTADDCDDTDAAVHPGVTEICDGIDNNCDTLVDDVGLWFVDDDGDGFGRTGTQTSGACDLTVATGVAAVGGDCNDADPAVFPTATEIPYDAVDDNCNGDLDNWDVDFDGHVADEHFAAAQTANQALPVDERWDLTAGDCDDTDPARFVGNPEVCDGVDNDCDDAVDTEDLANASLTDELTLRGQVQSWFADVDGDGAFGTAVLLCPSAVDPLLHSATGDDCFDSGAPAAFDGLLAADVHPAATELCDGADNDCDGHPDWSAAAFPGSTSLFRDLDGDGFGSESVQACGADPDEQIVALGDDCDDTQFTVNPGAVEVCGDTVRQDCSSVSIYDCDGDGQLGDYPGNLDPAPDCDDTSAAVFATDAPAAEVCDGIDNDCDALIDTADLDNLDTSALPFWYPDNDLDGWGANAVGVQQCDSPLGSHSIRTGDCDDADTSVDPETPWFRDADGDGFGDDSTETVSGCSEPDTVTAWVRQGGDCNDLDVAFHPDTRWLPDNDGDLAGDAAGVVQACERPAGAWVPQANGVDCNDADATVGVEATWFADDDGDGSGDGDASQTSCLQPAGFVANSGDCNDGNAGQNPFASEVCNGFDDNCDGLIDDADPSVEAPTVGGPLAYQDVDGDGFGSDVAKRFCVAIPATGWAEMNGDCADDDASVNPEQPEICDNDKDDDCDGVEQIPEWYVDSDTDAYGTGLPQFTQCDSPGVGFAARGGDCDDGDGAVNPGEAEVATCDGVDSDCDGTPEPLLSWTFDEDGDGFGDDADTLVACSAPTQPPAGHGAGQWVLQGGDCDDDPVTGLDISLGRIWYIDADGDQFGNDATARFDCPVVDDLTGEEQYTQLLTDWNGNGQYDFDDGVNPPDVQLTVFGGDCYDTIPDVQGPLVHYVDSDTDGWGDAADPGVLTCPTNLGLPVDGFATRKGDCDEGDPSVFPGADETAGDSIDSNCDGSDDPAGGLTWYPDEDGDGFGDADVAGTSVYTPGAVNNNADCDDTPGSGADVSNGIFVFVDSDEDGFGVGSPYFVGRCLPEVGEALVGTDCDDSTDQANPGLPTDDSCDGIDDNCDGQVDEGGWTPGFIDVDGDGAFGTPALGCNLAPTADDCNDGNAEVYPAAVEACDDVDNDCNPLTTEPTTKFYLDADGDTAGDPNVAVSQCDSPGSGWTLTPNDCDDTDPSVTAQVRVYVDGDEDGFGDGALVLGTGGCALDAMEAWVDGDCDDTLSSIAPGLPDDTCDRVDNDCDVLVDEDAATLIAYLDADTDNHGDPLVAVLDCLIPVGYAAAGDDCDDDEDTVHPGAAEAVCSGMDEDCDGVMDPGEVDVDGDGFLGCEDDCAPNEFLRNPGQVEACDGVPDNDCDVATEDPEVTNLDGDAFVACDDVDDNNPNLPIDTSGGGGGTEYTWYADADGDGFGDPAINTVAAVPPDNTYVLNSGDCDDDEPTVHPAMPLEYCDGLDNNCDGVTINGDPDVSNPRTGIFTVDSVALYAGDEDDSNGPSLLTLVEACSFHGSTPTLNDPAGGDIDLVELENDPDITTMRDCENGLDNGTLGTLYGRDADDDLVPGVEGAEDVFLHCPSGPSVPAGFVLINGVFDCEPYDDERAYEVGSGAYPDYDGDGEAAGYLPGQNNNEEETCVGAVFAVAGNDCDDRNGSSTTASNGPVQIYSQEGYNAAIENCQDAELTLHVPVDHGLAGAFRPASHITINGDGQECQQYGNTCLSTAGTLAAVANGSLTLRDLNVNAPLRGEASAGGLHLERVTLEEADVVFPWTLYMEDVELRRTSNPPGTQIYLDVSGGSARLLDVSFEGDGVGGLQTAIVQNGGDLTIEGGTFRDLTNGIDLQGGATLNDGSDLYIEKVDRPLQAIDGALLSLRDSVIRDGVGGLDQPVTLTASRLLCDDCEFDVGQTAHDVITTTGGGFQSVVEISDSTVRTQRTFIRNNDVTGFVEVSGSTFELFGAGALLRGSGLDESIVTSTVSSSSSVPLIIAAGNLEVRDVSVTGGGRIFDNNGGDYRVIRLTTDDVGQLLTQTSGDTRFVGLTTSGPMGTAMNLDGGDLEVLGAVLVDADTFLDQDGGTAEIDNLTIDNGTNLIQVDNGVLELTSTRIGEVNRVLSVNAGGEVLVDDLRVERALGDVFWLTGSGDLLAYDTTVERTNRIAFIQGSAAAALSGLEVDLIDQVGFETTGGLLGVTNAEMYLTGSGQGGYLVRATGGTIVGDDWFVDAAKSLFFVNNSSVHLQECDFPNANPGQPSQVQNGGLLSLDRVRIPNLQTGQNVLEVTGGGTLALSESRVEVDSVNSVVVVRAFGNGLADLYATTLVGPPSITVLPLVRGEGDAEVGVDSCLLFALNATSTTKLAEHTGSGTLTVADTFGGPSGLPLSGLGNLVGFTTVDSEGVCTDDTVAPFHGEFAL